MRNTIKGASGQCRGFLWETGDRITIQDRTGNALGFYLKSQDKTFTRSGALVGYGNQLMILLTE